MGKPGDTRVSSPAREPTRGSETSQYPEEQKSTEILLVAVSERGRGQTVVPWGCGGVGPTYASEDGSRSPLERGAEDGDSPVSDNHVSDVVEFLSNARLE